MKLTKNQLYTIVSTICSNEQQKLFDAVNAKKSSKEVTALVDRAEKEFASISDISMRLSHGKSCPSWSIRPSRELLIQWAMRELGYDENIYLPRWFREQIELKIQMSFIEAKDLKDLEKKVGYKFVIV